MRIYIFPLFIKGQYNPSLHNTLEMGYDPILKSSRSFIAIQIPNVMIKGRTLKGIVTGFLHQFFISSKGSLARASLIPVKVSNSL